MNRLSLFFVPVLVCACTAASTDDDSTASGADASACGFAGTYAVTYAATYGACTVQTPDTLTISPASSGYTVNVPSGTTATPASFDGSVCSATFGWTAPPTSACSGSATLAYSTGAFTSANFDGTLTVTGCPGADGGSDEPCTFHFSAVRR